MKTKKQFALLDFCTPDYFTGYNRPVVSIPVYSSMTNKDIIQAISEELIYSYECYGYTKTELLIIDQYINELAENENEIFVNLDYEEESTEFDDPMYLYFSFIKPVYSNGIMFCN